MVCRAERFCARASMRRGEATRCSPRSMHSLRRSRSWLPPGREAFNLPPTVFGSGRVPHVRPSVHGLKMDFSNAFTQYTRVVALGRGPFARVAVALEGLRPSFSAHVRFGEHGAPV